MKEDLGGLDEKRDKDTHYNLCSCIPALNIVFGFLVNMPAMIVLSYSLVMSVGFFLAIAFNDPNETIERNIVYGSLGLWYLSFNLAFFILIYAQFDAVYSLSALGSAFVFDSAAYFVGSRWGKHKLIKRISAGKSIEGVIGGFVFLIIFFLIYDSILYPFFGYRHFSWVAIIVLSAVFSFFGTVGDITQSVFKRNRQIKNAGRILPGHGGFWDRIDGSQSGYAMIIGTAGYIAGSLICAVFAHKIGLKRIAILGALFSAIGLTYFFFVKDFVALSFANFLTNIGMGFIEIGIGSLIGSLKDENVSGTLNRVNALFAFGALMSPFIVSLIVNYKINWQIAYLIGALFAILSLVISLKIKEVKSEEQTNGLKINTFNAFFVLIYIMIGIYVGYEATYSSWVTTFLTNFRRIDVAIAALSSSAFWIGMFLGRLFASYIKVKATVWLIFIVASSLASVVLSIAFANYYVSMTFVLLSGLFFASTYPTIQLMLIERSGGNIGNLMGVFVFFVGIGAALAQWMVSAASNLWGILVGFSLIPIMIFSELMLSVNMKSREKVTRER